MFSSHKCEHEDKLIHVCTIWHSYRQQGFGVLSVGLASQTLHLLVALLEDLQVEGALLPPTIDVKNIDGSNVAFDVQGRYSAWQRMQKMLSHFNLTNLLFNLAAITYRKVSG